MREVTTCLHNRIVTSQLVWEELWLSCEVQRTGQRYCKVDVSTADSAPRNFRLPTSLRITIFLVAKLSLLVYWLGTGTNTSVEDKESVVCLALTSGIIFVILVLARTLVCWTSHIIIWKFTKLLVARGASLCLGGATSASGLLLDKGEKAGVL